MDSPLCRICRGESTTQEPLFHPCKCKGSIKYIHQNCLMEWLKHSNRGSKQCDICNMNYKFRTIYDPNMPKRIPFSSISQRLIKNGWLRSIQFVSIIFYLVFVVITVPIYWKFSARVYTWIIEGHLPKTNPKFIDALFYGESPSGADVNSMIKSFIDYTYFSGLRYIFVFIVVHLALFVEHEWVVRDDGYAKLLLKRIGKEPKAKLADMFQNALNGLRQDARNANDQAGDVVDRMEMIAEALQDLNDNRAPVNNDAPINNAFNDNIIPNVEDQQDNDAQNNPNPENADPVNDVVNEPREYRWQDNPLNPEPEFVDEDFGFLGVDDDRQLLNMIEEREDHLRDMGMLRADPTNEPEEVPEQVPGQVIPEPPAVLEPAPQPEVAAALPGRLDLLEEGDDEEAIERMVDEVLDAQANDANIFALLGLTLGLKAPLIVMGLCNVVITVYLGTVYLVPSILGMSALKLVTVPIFKAGSSLVSKIKYDQFWDFLNVVDSYIKWASKESRLVEFLVVTSSSSLRTIVASASNLVGIEGDNDIGGGGKFIERSVNIVFGYSLIGIIIHNLMITITKSGNPVLGGPRKVYSLLFEAVCTFKVFSIFAIEIFFFPVYCGWLLDFCIAPILLESFYKEGEFTVLFTSTSPLFTVDYIRVALYWAIGTLYMLLFALFVGMIRSKILRPGVLFFIRSPDDPNARLIHDALMKPLGLQLSRIYLSAKVYTGFVLIGIGGFTWGLRFLLTDATGSTLLPLKVHNFNDAVLGLFIITAIIGHKDIIVKYAEHYWKYAFKLSCHSLRLSHFILNKPIAEERGYLLYRNWIEQIKGTAAPDYSRPVTYREAMNAFATSDVKCCFVPNGNYIRVPDNDTVSRSYVKQMFVNVTKDDKLLARDAPDANATNNDDNNVRDEEDEEEEEYNSENYYTVVYKPPMLKIRCIQLVLLLWVFALFLIFAIVMVSLVIGRPFTKFFLVLSGSLDFVSTQPTVPLSEHLQKVVDAFGWKFADARSISIGLSVQLLVLVQYDRRRTGGPPNRNNDGGIRNEAQNAREGGIPVILAGIFPFNNGFTNEQNVTTRNLLFMSKFISFIWCGFVHIFVIDLPYKLAHDMPLFPFDSFLITSETALMHLLASPFTIYPAINYNFANEIAGMNEYNVKVVKNIINLRHNLIKLFIIVNCAGYNAYTFSWDSLKVNPIAFMAYVTGHLVYKSASVVKKYDLEIRNEKYIRGRALENVD